MAMVAADAPREEKQEWLMRPFNWAYSVAWFSMFFGFVHWYFNAFDDRYLALGLIAACAVIFGLLLWGFQRLNVAVRR